DPIFVVEGPTDTAAGLTVGLDVVGRPSVSGGYEQLAELLKDLHVCFILERDGKTATEPGPGQTMGTMLARRLLSDCASVKAITPPPGIKDLREWIIAGATAESVQAAARAAAPLDATECVAAGTLNGSSPKRQQGGTARCDPKLILD